MRIRLWVGLVAVGGLVASACLDNSITGTRPLTLTMTVAPEVAAVDELVTAIYSATGTGMFRVIVDWGDGVVDTVPLSGTVVTITGPADHMYIAPGSFDVVGTVHAQNGTISAQASVTIN